MDGTIEYSHDNKNPDFDTITLLQNIELEYPFGSTSYTNFTYKHHFTSKDIKSVSGYISYSYSGKLYNSNHGYAIISTVNAEACCTQTSANPECPLDPENRGRVIIAGDGSSAMIELEVSTNIVSLDKDEDGLYEESFQCSDIGKCI
jgi:hypothetical protein